MKTKDFTDRVLVTGATLATVVWGGAAIFAVWGLADRIKNWRSWAHLNALDQWAQIPMGVLMIFMLGALIVSLWTRLLTRRRILGGAWKDGGSNPYIPRGKYAFWKPARRPLKRHVAFGALLVRKRMRH